jgi:uncharacterized protein with ATP-grasp and redox domains
VKPEAKCGLCILEWVYGRTVSQNKNKDIPQLFKNITKLMVHKIDSSTNLAAICNDAVDLIYEFVTPRSPFWDKLKQKTNEYVKTLLPKAQAYIEKAKTPKTRLERAMYLAATGNVAPMGAPSGAFTFPELMEMIEGKGPTPVLRGNAYEAALNASRVLYVTDNAGEIGFDSLLISMLKAMGKSVTVVVKEPAYFEDATMEDALFYGLDRIADKVVTVNKVFMPGKDKSPVNQAFRKSDLIIVKGTGNYDALRGETDGKAAIFLLKIKCDPIAKDIGVNEGKFVVKLDK